MLYFKNRRNKNNSVCLAICVGVLALIWYLICEKWMWNKWALDIWLALGHIRKVAVVKSPTRPSLSCWCHLGSSSTRAIFSLSSRTESIPHLQIVSGSILSWRTVFSDVFSHIQQPAILPLICQGTRPMSFKGNVALQQNKLEVLNSLGLGTVF